MKNLLLSLVLLFASASAHASDFSSYAFGGVATSKNAGFENPGFQLGLEGSYFFTDEWTLEGTLVQRWQQKIGEYGDQYGQSAKVQGCFTHGFRGCIGSSFDSFATEHWYKVSHSFRWELGYGRIQRDRRFVAVLYGTGWNNSNPEIRVPYGVAYEFLTNKSGFGFDGVRGEVGKLEFHRSDLYDNGTVASFNVIFFRH